MTNTQEIRLTETCPFGEMTEGMKECTGHRQTEQLCAKCASCHLYQRYVSEKFRSNFKGM